MTKKVEALAIKQARGTKRTCQNSECEARFYDLGRSPITCPVCASPYVMPSAPVALAAEPRKSKRVEYTVEVETPPGMAPADAGAAVAEAEAEEPADSEEDETVLEVVEEDGSDVSNIIGGPVAEDEKEP
jgi:hypothetical protein